MIVEAHPQHASPEVVKQRPVLLAGESELRQKNQVTVPRQIVKALGLHPGDRLIFEVREGELNEVRIRRLRSDYSGALAGVYGSSEEVAAYLREEREAWGD